MQIQSSVQLKANAPLRATIEKPAAALLLALSATVDDGTASGFDALLKTRVSAEVLDQDGSRTRLYNRVPLRALLVYATAGEGSARIFGGGSGINMDAVIPLGVEGALNITNNEVIDVQVESEYTAGDEAVFCEIRAFESAARTPAVPVFSLIDIPTAGTQKQYSVADATSIVIEPGKITDIQFRYTNGLTVQASPSELFAMAQMANDVVAAGAGFRYDVGGMGYVSVPVDMVEEITVTSRDNNATLYIVTEHVVTDLDAVIGSNSRLDRNARLL